MANVLLAQSGHPTLQRTCLLLGVKRACRLYREIFANDPKRTELMIGPTDFLGDLRIEHTVAQITFHAILLLILGPWGTPD